MSYNTPTIVYRSLREENIAHLMTCEEFAKLTTHRAQDAIHYHRNQPSRPTQDQQADDQFPWRKPLNSERLKIHKQRILDGQAAPEQYPDRDPPNTPIIHPTADSLSTTSHPSCPDLTYVPTRARLQNPQPDATSFPQPIKAPTQGPMTNTDANVPAIPRPSISNPHDRDLILSYLETYDANNPLHAASSPTDISETCIRRKCIQALRRIDESHEGKMTSSEVERTERMVRRYLGRCREREEEARDEEMRQAESREAERRKPERRRTATSEAKRREEEKVLAEKRVARAREAIKARLKAQVEKELGRSKGTVRKAERPKAGQCRTQPQATKASALDFSAQTSLVSQLSVSQRQAAQPPFQTPEIDARALDSRTKKQEDRDEKICETKDPVSKQENAWTEDDGVLVNPDDCFEYEWEILKGLRL